MVSTTGVVCTLLVVACYADYHSHKYQDAEPVQVWANKVGPFNNPLETYKYFILPLCPPSDNEDEWNEQFPSLGEALSGDELIEHKKLKINFKEDETKAKLCTQHLDEDAAEQLRQAILQQYWYQFYIDDLPVWATIGKVIETPKGEKIPYIFTHQYFSISYNGERIVQANLTAEDERAIPVGGGKLDFTYTVHWEKSDLKYEQRFIRYLDNQFFEHKIHWFSIFNSFMMVMFLTALVFIILSRTLKNDYIRYQKEAEDIEENKDTFQDESGWKQVYADVFRVPPSPCLFCALVGSGYQLIYMVLALIVLALVFVLYASRGTMLTLSIIVWAITSYLNGYYSGQLFNHYAAISPGLHPFWIRTLIYSATLFPGVCGITIFMLNFIAWAYHSSQAIPFFAMVVVLLIWGLGSFPLVITGSIMSRMRTINPKDVPRVSTIPRCVPETRWYLERKFLVLFGGVLPFGSIWVELYFILTSFWNYKFYYVYGCLFLVFVMLILVTMCTSIVATYLLLNAEDHRWQWTSFGLSGSTSLYMFLYAVYFFFVKTKMSGLLMTSLYFGYMALFSFGFGLMTGAVGFVAANAFINRIYQNIKLD